MESILPNEIWNCVFYFLPIKSFPNALQTCKTWHTIIHQYNYYYQYYYCLFYPFHYEKRLVAFPIALPLKTNFEEQNFWTVQTARPVEITSFLIRLNSIPSFLLGQKQWLIWMMQQHSWATDFVQKFSIHNFIQEEIDNLITFGEVANEYQLQDRKLQDDPLNETVKENLSILKESIQQQLEENPDILLYPNVMISIQNANPLIFPEVILIGEFCMLYLLLDPYFRNNLYVLQASISFNALKTFSNIFPNVFVEHPSLLRLVASFNSEVFKYLPVDFWFQEDILRIAFSRKRVIDLRKWSRIHGKDLGERMTRKIAKLAVRNYANNLFSIPRDMAQEVACISEALYHDATIYSALPQEWQENEEVMRIALENVRQNGDANILFYSFPEKVKANKDFMRFALQCNRTYWKYANELLQQDEELLAVMQP